MYQHSITSCGRTKFEMGGMWQVPRETALSELNVAAASKQLEAYYAVVMASHEEFEAYYAVVMIWDKSHVHLVVSTFADSPPSL